MEKCTFCIHRVRQGKSQAKVAKRELKDGDIKTACQQACPTHAIVFGDLNNPESQVSKIWNSKRQYSLLEELNTQPAVRYASKIRNTDQLKGGHGGHHTEGGHEGVPAEGRGHEEGHHS